MRVNDFKNRVYKLTREIPKGRVATYGQIARLAGNPQAARAVGLLMKNNPDAPNTPCHRVVAGDGSLNGYSRGKGVATKRKMLLSEGVEFVRKKVDLSSCCWA